MTVFGQRVGAVLCGRPLPALCGRPLRTTTAPHQGGKGKRRWRWAVPPVIPSECLRCRAYRGLPLFARARSKGKVCCPQKLVGLQATNDGLGVLPQTLPLPPLGRWVIFLRIGTTSVVLGAPASSRPGGRSPPEDVKRPCVGFAHEPASGRRSQRFPRARATGCARVGSFRRQTAGAVGRSASRRRAAELGHGGVSGGDHGAVGVADERRQSGVSLALRGRRWRAPGAGLCRGPRGPAGGTADPGAPGGAGAPGGR